MHSVDNFESQKQPHKQLTTWLLNQQSGMHVQLVVFEKR